MSLVAVAAYQPVLCASTQRAALYLAVAFVFHGAAGIPQGGY
jgi:hypothetical protein